MGLLGIGKGLIKIASGVINGDSETVLVGIKKVAVNTVTTIGHIVTGKVIEKTDTDDDED